MLFSNILLHHTYFTSIYFHLFLLVQTMAQINVIWVIDASREHGKESVGQTILYLKLGIDHCIVMWSSKINDMCKFMYIYLVHDQLITYVTKVVVNSQKLLIFVQVTSLVHGRGWLFVSLHAVQLMFPPPSSIYSVMYEWKMTWIIQNFENLILKTW